jgi:TldD protein
MSAILIPEVTEYEPVQKALLATLPAGAADASIFVERRSTVTARFADSRITDMTVTRQAGSNARWLTPQRSWYQAFDQVEPPALTSMLLGGPPRRHTSAWRDGDSVAEIVGELRSLLEAIDRAGRDEDPRIEQVLIDAEWHEQLVTTVRPEGIGVERRHLRYLTLRTVAREHGRVGTGFYTPATSDPTALLDPVQIGVESARRALTTLYGRELPVQRMPVVVGGGRGMVLIHEACCHPLEGDEILRGSVYADRLGTPIAAPGVTITDDPLTPGGPGSYRFDDEGAPAAPTTMVDDGVLNSFLTDRASALRLGTRSTGNGRRESFRDIPIPRMSNTCVGAGQVDPGDIVADTAAGIYAVHVGGGEVIESTGDFVFRVHNGFLIENGRITDPIQETTVQGNGIQVLRDIDAVGTDVRLGAAKCGKFNQLIPVGVQGPTLRIRSLLVGGTLT